MNLLDATLSCAITTAVEWRKADGTVLSTAIVAAGQAISGMLDSEIQIPYTYEVYARPADGSAEWERMFEIDPVKRTVARFDL